MAEHEFTLRFDLGRHQYGDALADRFYEKTGGDALFGLTAGVPYGIYTREGETQCMAILKAIEEANELGFTVIDIEAAPKGEMKLYHWADVESIRNYRSGDAVVMARNEEQARRIFRRDLETHLRDQHEWAFSDTEDTEEADKLLVRADLDAAAPITSVSDDAAVVIVRGSE